MRERVRYVNTASALLGGITAIFVYPMNSLATSPREKLKSDGQHGTGNDPDSRHLTPFASADGRVYVPRERLSGTPTHLYRWCLDHRTPATPSAVTVMVLLLPEVRDPNRDRRR